MEWISVKDRLPEKQGLYLICVGENIYIGKYSGRNDTSQFLWSWWLWTGATHWMLLPEPPEVK